MEINPLFFCLKCRAHLTFDQQSIIHYFEVGRLNSCPKCSDKFDLFESVQKQIDSNFMNNSIYGFIGAKSKIVVVPLKEGEHIDLDLAEKGIPKDAKLLHLNYTPEGVLFPMDVAGNEPLRRNDSLKRVIRTFKTSDESTLANKLNCWATYVETNTENYESIKNLVDAFCEYEKRNYKSAIIPANVAVELPLGLFVEKVLSTISSKERLESFLDAATYSHQLNVLLPYICKKDNLAPLYDNIRGYLNRLRSLRNNMAHTGGASLDLERAEISKLLTAALFGNIYLSHLNRKIA